MVHSFVSRNTTSTEGSWGAPKSALHLSFYCIKQPPSFLSPLLCGYPNKLAVSEGGGKRRRREWRGEGGWALWRRSRLSVSEVHGSLKPHTHRQTHTHTPCLSDWMLREEREKKQHLGSGRNRVQQRRRLSSTADPEEALQLSS